MNETAETGILHFPGNVTGPTSFNLCGSDGRVLLALHGDGTVTANLDDTDEAARVFVDYVRKYWSSPTPINQQGEGKT